MEHPQDHQRRLVAGVCMIATPLAGLATWLVTPALHRDETDALRAIAGATGRATVGVILDTLTVALAVFAVLGLVHLLRERAPRLGQLGGGLALVGLVGGMLNVGIQTAAIRIAERGPTPADAALYKDILTGPIGVLAIASGMLIAVGMLILAVALYRTQAAPPVSAFFVGLFAVGDLAGFAMLSSAVVVAAFAVLTAALVPIGYAVLTETDLQWEHTPRYRGYHALTA